METTFEKELRKLFDHDALLSSTKFVGRMCYGSLGEDIRVRAEFITLGYADHYEALKISLINRTEGVIDSAVLRFGETMGVKKVSNPLFPNGLNPYLWKNGNTLQWYAYQPARADYEKLFDVLNDYLEVFREPTEEAAQGMARQMG